MSISGELGGLITKQSCPLRDRTDFLGYESGLVKPPKHALKPRIAPSRTYVFAHLAETAISFLLSHFGPLAHLALLPPGHNSRTEPEFSSTTR